MSGETEKRRLLMQLNEIVAELLDAYRNLPDPEIMVYELWTAKDVLSHVTFWHESFARNVGDLARNVKPTPLKGSLSVLNQAGVDEMRPYPLQAVIERFEASHRIIQSHILNPGIRLIPYKIGSRAYTPEEHLEIVCSHIARHLRDVVKARNLHVVRHSDDPTGLRR